MIKLSQSKLDINDLSLRPVFEDMQGNILKSHGRSHSRHLFLQFTADAEQLKPWLGQLGTRITSALEQHETSLDFKASGKEHLFTGFLLSYEGYQALGIRKRKIPDDKAFRRGMKDIQFRYDTGPTGIHARTINPMNDNPEDWEPAFQERIDALVILAYGGASLDSDICEAYLDAEVKKLEAEIAGIAKILTVEKGFVLRNEQGTVIEHFGYADGISNPVFFKSDFDRWEAREGTDQNDPSAHFSLIAVEDPGGQDPDNSWGTYFVYRKMQQNIKGFREQSRKFAAILSNQTGQEVSEDLAGAFTVGRMKDGTPLIKGSEGKAVLNNFGYEQDMEGMGCPFRSHIRKTNPRGDTNRLHDIPIWSERSKRIARRGISYGSEDLSPSTEWTDAGLLFLSCQSDIEQQFLVMQCGWCDNPNFLVGGTDHDPITGDQNIGTEAEIGPWEFEIDGKKVSTDFRYQDLVRIRGGEYFFAPSISFCKQFI
jgi:Dyp-type peroxidase family